ncbi:MAG: hypothetical protein WCK17_04385 [Verrucomicrobiota bacterium]
MDALARRLFRKKSEQLSEAQLQFPFRGRVLLMGDTKTVSGTWGGQALGAATWEQWALCRANAFPPMGTIRSMATSNGETIAMLQPNRQVTRPSRRLLDQRDAHQRLRASLFGHKFP